MAASMSVGELRELVEIAWGEVPGSVTLTFSAKRVAAHDSLGSKIFVEVCDEIDEGDGMGELLAACAAKLAERATASRGTAKYYRELAEDSVRQAERAEARLAQIRATLDAEAETR